MNCKHELQLRISLQVLSFLSSRLFVVAVVAILASGQDLVTLDENNAGPVTVPLGSPLTLKCNLTTPKQNIKWMNWYFNSSGPSRNSTLLNKTPQKVENDTEDLDFMFQVTSNAREENSGWYFCCATIEIPKLRIVKSSERHVLISKYYFSHANTKRFNDIGSLLNISE